MARDPRPARRLPGVPGRRPWRSLAEATTHDGFQEALEREHPAFAAELRDPRGRRDFMKLMGASLALAGMTGCTRQPEEKIVPYVTQPESLVPGRPLFYASAITLGGMATGVLAESHMGRPTKLEGNPLHPSSLGGSDVLTQASLLGLYDPDRARTVTHRGRIAPWSDLRAALEAPLEELVARQGEGLRLLTGEVTSPSLAAQLRLLRELLPRARWHRWEPVSRDRVRAGARLAFDRIVSTTYLLEEADVVVTLDADTLTQGPGALAHARGFAARRRPGGSREMSRLYSVESTPTATGTMADHRLSSPAHRVEAIARALARELGLPVAEDSLDSRAAAWVRVAARDLADHRGTGLVVPGEGQPAAVHALAHAMNHALGSVGRCVVHREPVEVEPVGHLDSLSDLTDDMAAGRVMALFILGPNPAYSAPADIPFATMLDRVPLRVHLSQAYDETSALCHWHVPEAHDLEAWGDARGHDGTVSLIQPLIAPLYDGKTALEMVALLRGEPNLTPHDMVRDTWRGVLGEAGFERRWRRALHDGVIADTALPPLDIAPVSDWARRLPAPPAPDDGLEVVFRPDPSVYDGRFANNGWLQELPRPLSKLTWDNAALISPATAADLGLDSGQVVSLTLQGRTLEAPVWIMPGHADGSVTVHLGYGRTRAGRVGSGVGFDAYRLWPAGVGFATGATIAATGRRHSLVTTQEHHSMEDRALVRHASLAEFRQHPDFARHAVHEPDESMSLYPSAFSYDGQAWGMVLDLNACTGCNACVVACQAENNIPVVGREQVRAGREMHWLRIDRYYEGPAESPATYHQPVLCQHCENAPCEVVCPVGATVHSDEGLNDMVYNRCVGTRYCSNNCPYKVRRFNFLLYSDWQTPSLALQRNPDVTVRSRGVMEKCTYCVQRISAARIEARKESRKVQDGEIVTACQQACPTGAIVFGDLNDTTSRVAAARADRRTYGILTELGTRPRTTYQAIVRNPHPDLEEA